MLGFGPLGTSALGEVVGGRALALSSDILEEVITLLVQEHLLVTCPRQLYHYTTLDTASQIINLDNIRLSHAEYSNDQNEMATAKDLIKSELRKLGADPFFAQVLQDYENLAPTLDAYIFCMSSGLEQGPLPQDMLSQWRAYGHDGRGVCLTLGGYEFGRLGGNVPGLRINPVIYELPKQTRLIAEILQCGKVRNSGDPDARSATVAALVFCTPLMKASEFAEEREWRLIFMPPQRGPQPQLEFHPRRDFLAPFINFHELWNKLRLDLLEVPELRQSLRGNLPNPPPGPHLVPIQEITVGPSGHQLLNVRAFEKLLDQAKRSSVAVQLSKIPYRSLN